MKGERIEKLEKFLNTECPKCIFNKTSVIDNCEIVTAMDGHLICKGKTEVKKDGK